MYCVFVFFFSGVFACVCVRAPFQMYDCVCLVETCACVCADKLSAFSEACTGHSVEAVKGCLFCISIYIGS